jgi:hypothetical protein
VETQIQLSSPGKAHYGKLLCNQLHFIKWAHTPETSERWRQRKILLAHVLSQEEQLMKYTAYEKEFMRALYNERTLSPNQHDYFDSLIKKKEKSNRNNHLICKFQMDS